jgi:curved DNA-binding protein
MPVEYKDYYEILQVARTASGEEIRKAFRGLARVHHPDVAVDKDQAEIRFKEIIEAYEVLSDADKRKTYDAVGRGWSPGAEFASDGDWHTTTYTQQGASFEFRFGSAGFSDFFQALFGHTSAAKRQAPPQEPDSGTGNDAAPGDDVESEIFVSLQEVAHGSVRYLTLQRDVRCWRCYGTRSVNNVVCPVCHGRSRLHRQDRHQVRIPAGVAEGQRLRLTGKGDTSRGRGAPGDLYLRVRFSKHPQFEVEGANLVCQVDLAPWEAVLGTNLAVPTLDGTINIHVPAGAQHAQRLRIREQGLPARNVGRGDLHVQLRIRLPERLSDREKALWVQLASESTFRPREAPQTPAE